MHIDQLEPRKLFSVAFNVESSQNELSIRARGSSSYAYIQAISLGDGEGTRPEEFVGTNLSLSGRFSLNGVVQSGTVLDLPNLDRYKSIHFFGTPGADDVLFSGYDTSFLGIFAVSTGGGDDTIRVYTGDFDHRDSGIVISSGKGNDKIYVDGNSKTDITLRGGKGKDYYEMQGYCRRFILQDSDSSSSISITDSIFSGGLFIETGPAEDDIQIYNCQFTHHTRIFTSDGLDTLHNVDNKLPFAAIIDLGTGQ